MTESNRVPVSENRPSEAKRRLRLLWFVLGVVLFVVAVTAVSATAGYFAGLERRDNAQAQQLDSGLQEQFDLGVQDLLEGDYTLARQRFEYILEVDSGFPGAVELLGEVLEALDQPTLTPSPVVTSTQFMSPTATLNFDSLDDLFQGAQSAIASGNWGNAIEAIVFLIAESPEYRRSEVNTLLYQALRGQGLEKIWAGQHEQGIFDLTLASRLAALDGQAANWLSSAAFYTFANSYIGLDWELATSYFAQICQAGIWDACWKYARSAWQYADLLLEEDPCAAVIQYEASYLTVNAAELPPTATEAANVCLTATAVTSTATETQTPTETSTFPAGPTFTPTSTFTETPTPSPTGPTPTPTDTPTVTPTPTPVPTETPTPTPT
jgi:hypothetical protein